MRPYLQPATVLFFGLWVVLLIGGRSRFLQDPGTFWHTAVGDRIIAFGYFDTDPYSFSFAGAEWIPHQWLGECAMSVAYRIGGFDTLLVLTVTLLTAVYTGLGVRLLRAGLHLSVVAVLVAFGVAASSSHFHVRPHLATITGMAVLLVYLTDVDNSRIPLARLAWLIPVFWLWSNIHGGALGGLATFALAIAGWIAYWRLGRASPVQERRDVLRLIGLWSGCAVVCLLNPYTYRLPMVWIEIYRMPGLSTIIREHVPLDPASPDGLYVIGFGILYVCLLASVPVRRIRVVWLIPVVWFVLTWMRIRHAPLFAVTGLVAIADLFPHTRFAAALVRRQSDLYAPTPDSRPDETPVESARPFLLPVGVVIVALCMHAGGVVAPVLGRGWARHDPTRWPVDLLPELKAHEYARPGGTRLFNELNYGGFVIHQLPGYRVFVDDRCELYGNEFLTHLVQTQAELHLDLFDNPAEPFAEWQAAYGSFDLALVATDGGFDVALARIPAWVVVRRTGTATLYRKVELP